MTNVETYLKAQGFTTQRTSLGLIADGPQQAVEHTFNVHVTQIASRGREAKGLNVAPTLPGPLAQVGATVSIASLVKHVDSKPEQRGIRRSEPGRSAVTRQCAGCQSVALRYSGSFRYFDRRCVHEDRRRQPRRHRLLIVWPVRVVLHRAYNGGTDFTGLLVDPAFFAPNDRWGSGGGISTIYDKPWYQYLVDTGSSMRTIPDVSMHMGGCPGGTLSCSPDASSAITAIGGNFYLLIGTSASAPEFAGLLAVTEGTIGTRLGNANGYVYALAAVGGSSVYHDNIPGDNGYASKRGYNYVVGNGTPKAAEFSLNGGGPLAGVPQTPTNP